MGQRFEYPSDLRDKIREQSRWRLLFWGLFLSPFWGFGIVSYAAGDGLLGLGIALGASGLVVFFDCLLRRIEGQTRFLTNHYLDYDGTYLRQIASDGTVVGEIDLRRKFRVSYPYFAAGNARYEVVQEAEGPIPGCIQFSSRIGNAEYLVKRLLQYHEWPPGANAT